MNQLENQRYFHEYFAEWIEIYKRGAVRDITYQKYLMTLRRLVEIAPKVKICEINKRCYQALINEYARTHEKQTVMDFHHHLKAVILDAVDEGLIMTDPTRKVTLKGKAKEKEKFKFLNEGELQVLLKNLTLTDAPNWDWLILLLAKTGLRFSEALALTPRDFDFNKKTVKVSRTWNYKGGGGFGETKNLSSKRLVSLDDCTNQQFRILVEPIEADNLIFVKGRVFNSTVNSRLRVLCARNGLPAISLHGLRHTHASILIYAGVSIASIAKRLGHANTTTTQETYLHIIRELEDKDNEKIMQGLARIS